jgi:hypothetical protein
MGEASVLALAGEYEKNIFRFEEEGFPARNGFSADLNVGVDGKLNITYNGKVYDYNVLALSTYFIKILKGLIEKYTTLREVKGLNSVQFLRQALLCKTFRSRYLPVALFKYNDQVCILLDLQIQARKGDFPALRIYYKELAKKNLDIALEATTNTINYNKLRNIVIPTETIEFLSITDHAKVFNGVTAAINANTLLEIVDEKNTLAYFAVHAPRIVDGIPQPEGGKEPGRILFCQVKSISSDRHEVIVADTLSYGTAPISKINTSLAIPLIYFYTGNLCGFTPTHSNIEFEASGFKSQLLAFLTNKNNFGGGGIFMEGAQFTFANGSDVIERVFSSDVNKIDDFEVIRHGDGILYDSKKELHEFNNVLVAYLPDTQIFPINAILTGQKDDIEATAHFLNKDPWYDNPKLQMIVAYLADESAKRDNPFSANYNFELSSETIVTYRKLAVIAAGTKDTKGAEPIFSNVASFTTRISELFESLPVTSKGGSGGGGGGSGDDGNKGSGQSDADKRAREEAARKRKEEEARKREEEEDRQRRATRSRKENKPQDPAILPTRPQIPVILIGTVKDIANGFARKAMLIKKKLYSNEEDKIKITDMNTIKKIRIELTELVKEIRRMAISLSETLLKLDSLSNADVITAIRNQLEQLPAVIKYAYDENTIKPLDLDTSSKRSLSSELISDNTLKLLSKMCRETTERKGDYSSADTRKFVSDLTLRVFKPLGRSEDLWIRTDTSVAIALSVDSHAFILAVDPQRKLVIPVRNHDGVQETNVYAADNFPLEGFIVCEIESDAEVNRVNPHTFEFRLPKPINSEKGKILHIGGLLKKNDRATMYIILILQINESRLSSTLQYELIGVVIYFQTYMGPPLQLKM